MKADRKPSVSRLKEEEKLAKSRRHDAEFLVIRRKAEAANIEKTLRLRALRRNMEEQKAATAAAEAAAKPPARKRTAKAAEPAAS